MDYAESPSPLIDSVNGGVAWTKYGSVSVPGYQGHVIQVGSQFWMYVKNFSSHVVNLFTSADGVTWALDAASPVISPGSGAVESVTAFQDSDGSFWLFTDGADQLYHSSDGKTAWTLTSTPGIGNGGMFAKVNGSYLNWGYFAGQLWPAEIYRFKSASMGGTWAQDLPYPAYLRQAEDEGPDTVQGQVWGQAYLELGGKTYMWYTATRNGEQAPEAWIYYLKLATYPGTMSQLVGTSEQATTVEP